MRILIDIGHPAHVHLFRNFARVMIDKGNEVLFTCREKEYEKELLSYYGFPYVSFGRKYKSTLGKIFGMVKFDYKEWRTCLKFKPDVLLSHGSLYAAFASSLVRKPHISFEDTFNMEQVRLYEPFSDVILTGDYPHPRISDKEIHFAGYHELAYLHPNRFKPDDSILKELGVSRDEKYVIIRFVAWNATHDVGHKGIFFENKLKAVEEFSKYSKVFISSEAPLPEQLQKFKLTTSPNRIFDVEAFATLLFGESSTMSEEAAMLGIPSIYLLNKGTCYTKHLENDYHLMFNYSESEEDQLKAIEKGVELLQRDNLREEWLVKKNKMLSDKIDVTAFLVWFVENYPESKKIMKENPDYQYRFK